MLRALYTFQMQIICLWLANTFSQSVADPLQNRGFFLLWNQTLSQGYIFFPYSFSFEFYIITFYAYIYYQF